MTPNAPTGGRSAKHATMKGRTATRADGSKVQVGLEHQAAHWPTPAARDHRGTNSLDHVTTNGTGRMHLDQLPNFVAHLFRPFATTDYLLPDRPTPSGSKSSETRRRLNPLFVEWLMGWPEGLSGFDTAATASCHSPQPSPGCGCINCWLNRQRELLAELLTIEAPVQSSFL